MFKQILRIVVGVAGFFCSLKAYAFSLNCWFFNCSHTSLTGQANTPVVKQVISQTQGLNPHVFALALQAYQKLRQKGYDAQQVLTVVDYSLPSVQPRLWVIDLKDLSVRFHTLVANGKNSGGNIASVFSDRPGSHDSSIGVFLTSDTYMGKHGYSLRLDGMDPGFNDKARGRDIVVHAANYVSTAFAKLHGRLGRSFGCFALNPVVAPAVIHEIKQGTVLFAYYPDRRWLSQSQYFRA